jgi:hypothetical protein
LPGKQGGRGATAFALTLSIAAGRHYDLAAFSLADWRLGETPAVSLLLLLSLSVVTPPPQLDTLVVCPAEFRTALKEWETYRRAQGHELTVIDPPPTAEELHTEIRRVGKSGSLKFLILIGDVPVRGLAMRIQPAKTTPPQLAAPAKTVPTNYVAAKVNVRWGSDLKIASDFPYADVNGDGTPDVAIGRIPADSASELATILRKSVRYERQTAHGGWQRRLNFTSGKGGFGAVTDAVIQAAARQVILQNVPAGYETQHIFPGTADPTGQVLVTFAARVRRQLSEGSLAWVYMGHGRATELDHVPTPIGTESILAVDDVRKLRCGAHPPLAVLVACSTGAADDPRDCLAEELLKADEGPVAVIAATRITMPYGNTVLGCELLRACFRDRPPHLGETVRIAAQKTLAAPAEDSLRASLESLAAGLSPHPVDLPAERREHVLMYHLYGDPLLHLRYAD